MRKEDYLYLRQMIRLQHFMASDSSGYNALKRTIKTPKLYFYDTGLVYYLTKWSSPQVVMNGAMRGALYGSYIDWWPPIYF